MNETAPDRWLSTKQAAALLGLHQDTLRRYRRVGGGPVFARIGSKAVRYKASELEAWMSLRTATSIADEAARAGP